MTVAVTINPTDVTAAANFLEEYLSDKIPDGDFTKGTALRDLTINALASVVAFLRADAAQIRDLQSLATIEAATTGDDAALADAAAAILSNFFISRKSGSKARGIAVGHISVKTDIFISSTTAFYYDTNLVFYVDTDLSVYSINARELIPIIDETGAVIEYQFSVPLVASANGIAYNVLPNIFSRFDRFNPYVTRIDSINPFVGGTDIETPTEVIARAPTAISVRNLINERSITATLEDNFSEIEALLVVGMGQPEMQRDTAPLISPHILFHVGGAVDIYLRTALVETTFTGTVGGLFARPDGIVTLFRDATVSLAAVLPGDVIRVVSGFPEAPVEFMVISTDGVTLTVSEKAPFPFATEESNPPSRVSYTIGRIGPEYNDVVADAGFQPYTFGTTSRRSAKSGRITLPGGPVMDILDVAVLNPPTAEAAFKSQIDGFVHFTNHVNTTPTNVLTPTLPLEFQTIVHNPSYAQSALQWMEVVVGPATATARWDNTSLRIKYRTLQAFSTIDLFVRGERERVLAAFPLPRAHNPVTLTFTLVYRLKATAPAFLNDAAIVNTIVNFINAFDATNASIDVSTIIQLVKDNYTDIASIVPQTTGAPILSIQYVLRAPTGDVITYSTNDVVEVSDAKRIAGPSLTLAALGVTNRTLRYITSSADIVVKRDGT